MHGLNGQRVLVMGLGRLGGGLGVTRWLVQQGASVIVSDRAPAADLADPLENLGDLVESGAVELALGGHDAADFTAVDMVVANPAVPEPWENEFLLAAHAAGVPVTTEIRLLTDLVNRDRTIGVTGTAGKSTTAAMIHHVLTRIGHRAHLGGNIGGSLLNSIDAIGDDDWVVLELSSAQLYWLGKGIGTPTAAGFSPHIAVLTNLAPNHLDWHGSFEHYAESKHNICRYQRARYLDQFIYGFDPLDVLVEGWTDKTPTEPYRIVPGRPETDTFPVDQCLALLTPGRHNEVNARMAVLAVLLAVGDADTFWKSFAWDCAETLADFRGLPHRLQLVAERDGIRYYNDSKSTTPAATQLAVDAFDDRSKIHLIAGGSDKGVDLSPISELAPSLGGLYTIGFTGRGIAESAPPDSNARFCKTLDAAVKCATTHMKAGDILLLSPGCASFDQFDNFEARGRAFVRLAGGTPGNGS